MLNIGDLIRAKTDLCVWRTESFIGAWEVVTSNDYMIFLEKVEIDLPTSKHLVEFIDFQEAIILLKFLYKGHIVFMPMNEEEILNWVILSNNLNEVA